MEFEPVSQDQLSDEQQKPVPDEALLAAVAVSNEAAFRLLYFRYYQRLRQFIVRMTRRADLAEEILNDTFFTVWQKAGTFIGRSAVSTWLFGIAYRKCLKALERTERWQTRYHAFEQEEAVSENNSPDEEAGEAQLRQRVHQGLNSLSPEQRMVFELTHFFGYSYPEIAEVADCSVNTVKTRMFHARRKLQASLRNEFQQ